ncbi:hypothetical protein AB0K43_11510 [Kitasatospora sp. NPDC049258]|uniref:hypothetical protein n=1 Tax=Kitasatospora sp. NPDC049258 TaxID=3155394 RepID=UPI00343F0054
MRLYYARPGRRSYRPVVDRLAVSMSGAVALVGFAVLTGALSLVGESHSVGFALGGFAVLGAVLGAVSRPVAAPLIAVAGWLFLNGFVVHRYASVEWGGTGTECARLGLLTAVALVASLPAALPRRRVRVQLLAVPARASDRRV